LNNFRLKVLQSVSKIRGEAETAWPPTCEDPRSDRVPEIRVNPAEIVINRVDYNMDTHRVQVLNQPPNTKE
jgi:hypothetical protein